MKRKIRQANAPLSPYEQVLLISNRARAKQQRKAREIATRKFSKGK